MLELIKCKITMLIGGMLTVIGHSVTDIGHSFIKNLLEILRGVFRRKNSELFLK